MPNVTFTEQEQECLRFLAKHYDQEDEIVSIESIPGYSELGDDEIMNMCLRFRRYSLVELFSSKSFKILPKILEVVHQLDNPAIPSMKYGIFISYANEDANLAEELKDALEEKGIRCFMATEDITVGDLWESAIRKALMASKRILFLLTPRSINRPWIHLEIGAAWALEKVIVPALDHVSPNDLDDLTRKYQAHVIETPDQRNRLVEKLAEELAAPTTDSAHDEAEGWNEFFRLGEALMESDTEDSETLTSAVLSMRR